MNPEEMLKLFKDVAEWGEERAYGRSAKDIALHRNLHAALKVPNEAPNQKINLYWRQSLDNILDTPLTLRFFLKPIGLIISALTAIILSIIGCYLYDRLKKWGVL